MAVVTRIDTPTPKGGLIRPNVNITGLSLGKVDIKVTPEELTAKAQEVTNEITKMSGHLDELRNLMDKTKGYWIGEGGDANRNMYYGLTDTIEKIMKRLKEHPVDLVAIAQTYTETELKIEEVASTLPGDILM